MPRTLLPLLFSIALATPLHAQPTATAPATTTQATAAEIDALIARLASDDWPERQRAEERLVQLAGDAVARLEAAAASAEDAEVRTRCESALHRIAVNDRIGPTMVTLKLAGATPREAYEALARQASVGAPLRAHPPTLWDTPAGAAAAAAAGARVTLDVDHLPFWEAARRLGAATGLELRPFNDELRVMAAGDRRFRGPTALSGPLMIVANSLSRSAAVDLATGATTSDFTASFTVVPEPKLRVLRTWPAVRVEQAVDENGASLVPPPLRQDGYQSSPRQATWAVMAKLAYPPNAGKRIARLRGAIVYTAQTQSQTIEVRDLLSARDVRRPFPGGAVTVQSCRQIGNQYELALVLTRPRAFGGVGGGGAGAGTPWDPFRQSLIPGLRVYDADGRPLIRSQPNTNGGDERLEITVRYAAEVVQPQNDRPGPPARLVWDIPTESRDLTATFEFTDLPMP